MQKQKLAYNHLLELGRFILDAQKDIGRRPKKTKTTPFGNIAKMLLPRIKTTLSPIIPLLLINLRSRPSKKTSAVVELVIQPLGLILPR